MTALNRKLIRNLLGMKGQVIAISLVIACGVATFVMSLATLRSLELTRAEYYRRYRFANVWTSLKRAPLDVADRIAEIPGVARVDPRIVAQVTLNIPGLSEPAVGQLISLPDYGQPPLNGAHLRRGRVIDPEQGGEVLVGEGFAEAHGFIEGDEIEAVINGRQRTLRIVGVVIAPEYIIEMPAGAMLPDNKRYGVFWMSETELEAAYDMDGAFNSIALSVTHDASLPDILRRVDDLTEQYGGLGAYDREDQVSYRYTSDEIKQLKTMGTVAPTIFLGVAAFLLNVSLTRLINTQREEIAALKAFGYTGREIGWHYLKFVLAIVLIGGSVGIAAGRQLGQGLTEMYTQFYRFPLFEFQFDWRVAVWAILISLLAAVVGTIHSVRGAIRLPPAEAMRPQPPASYRETFIERWGVPQLLSQTARIILRNLERQPYKAMFTCLGIAMAVAVLVVGSFGEDALDYLMEAEFEIAQRHDLMVTFVEPTTGAARFEVEHLPGVLRSESFRTVPVRLRREHRARRVGVFGLPEDRELFQLLNADLEVVPLPEEGLLLSRKLGELLGAEPGDVVRMEVLEEDRVTRDVEIAGFIDDFSGLAAYMHIDALHRLLREDDAVSGAYIAADPARLDTLYQKFKETPGVASVTITGAMFKSFEETFAKNMMQMRMFNIMFSVIIAFGVVYNSARISFSERSRELATLRVIGFTQGEVSGILLGELALLTLAAIPIGLGIGWTMCWLTSLTLDTDMYRIPLIIDRSTYAFAVVVILIATFVSAFVVLRRIDQLDLIGVLKTRD